MNTIDAYQNADPMRLKWFSNKTRKTFFFGFCLIKISCIIKNDLKKIVEEIDKNNAFSKRKTQKILNISQTRHFKL